MTEFDTSQDLSYSISSDISTQEEDAPTVDWIDQTISEAESGGFLGELAQHVNADPFADPNTYAAAVEQARAEGAFATDRPDYVPPAAPDREQIREAIFAKLRRPDGTPFAAGYPTGPAARKPMYDGEDARNGAWRSPTNPDLTNRTTIYADRATLNDRASNITDGLVVDAQGGPIDGRWGWVIDATSGSLMLFDLHEQQWFTPDGAAYTKQPTDDTWWLLGAGYRMRVMHHTSAVAGMPVAGAGILELDEGRIQQITDESGHYRPDGAQQFSAVQSLDNRGADLDEAKIRLTGTTMGERPTDKADWINAAATGSANFPTGDVDLSAEQFLQTGGDEYQIRMKQSLNEQIKARGDQPGTQYYEGEGTAEEKDEPAPVREELVTDPNTGRQKLVIWFDDGNYREYDPNDPTAPRVPAPNPVANVDYERKRDGGWQKRTTFESGSYNLDDVDESEVPPELRAPAPAPGAQAPGIDQPGDISFSETEQDASAHSESGANEDESQEGDNANEDDDIQADFVRDARAYLAGSGRRAFADWLRTLPTHAQDTLLADAELAAAWRGENAAPPPAWQPAEADWAAAATANSEYLDSLDDRGTANFTVAGLSLIIGGGHDAQHAAWVGSAGDRIAGSVTTRKAAIGRGAGSLTFTGVPPAKQEVVRAAVARFSRKEVRFG